MLTFLNQVLFRMFNQGKMLMMHATLISNCLQMHTEMEQVDWMTLDPGARSRG